MAHAELVNPTGLALEPLLLADEQGRPLAVPLIQGTWHLSDAQQPVWLEKQPAIELGGQWWGDPAMTSLRLEPQVAFCKPVGTDVVLQRAAFADVPGALDQRHGERDHLFVGQDQRLEDEAGGVDEIGVWHRLTTPAARARA